MNYDQRNHRSEPPTDDWFVIRKPLSRAGMRLFCFPYAGGGASIYRQWADGLGPGIEVCAVQYPGRENRINTPPIADFHELTMAIFHRLLPRMTAPFAFFGHSLGAKVAFEVAKKLARERGYRPACLFVSGCRAPHIPARSPIHHLEGDAFVRGLGRYAGTPEAVLRDRELMALFLPMIKADFILDETYTSDPDETIQAPIYAFGGRKDRIARPEEVEAWARFTAATFTMDFLDGGHFFLNEHRPHILEVIRTALLDPHPLRASPDPATPAAAPDRAGGSTL